MENPQIAKVYDWNGPVLDVKPFRLWFKTYDPTTFDLFYNQGKKAETKATLMAAFEMANNQGLYPAVLMPNVTERFALDQQSEITPLIFTTVPRDTVLATAQKLGIERFLSPDQIIPLDEAIRHGRLPLDTIKEDPRVYVALLNLLETRKLRPLTYVDDTLPRIQAAIKGQSPIPQTQRFQRLFFFDEKATERKKQEEGYATVNTLMEVE